MIFGVVIIPHPLVAITIFFVLLMILLGLLGCFSLKDKSETYKRIVEFYSMVQTQFGATIQRVRSDDGTEFINTPLHTYME